VDVWGTDSTVIGGVVELAGVAVVGPDAAVWVCALEASPEGLAMAVGVQVDPASLRPGGDVYEASTTATIALEVDGRRVPGAQRSSGGGDWRMVADWRFAPLPDDRDGAVILLGWPERGLPETRFPLPAGALAAAAGRAHAIRGPA